MRLSFVGIVLLGALGLYAGYFGGAPGLVPGALALLWLAALWRFARTHDGDEAAALSFLWVLVVPAVTIAAQIELLGVITGGYEYRGVFAAGDAGVCTQVAQGTYDKQWACPLGAVLPTLLPGLLNLAPLAGLFAARPAVRLAAAIAGGLGAVRVLVPVAMYAAEGSDVTIIGSWQFPPAMGSEASVIVSLALWFVSLVTAVLFSVWRSWQGRLGSPPARATLA